MKQINLAFRSEAVEREFGKERRTSGKTMLQIYIGVLIAEMALVSISMVADWSCMEEDLPLAFIASGQLVLAVSCNFMSTRVSNKGFNIMVGIMNVTQALIVCIVMSTMHVFKLDGIVNIETWQFSALCLSIAGSTMLKHVFLLLGSDLHVKIMTIVAITLVYICWSENINSVRLSYFTTIGLAFLLLHSLKTFCEEQSMRTMFLNKRKNDEMNLIINRLLPVSMLITRYDKKKEQVFLHKSNSKLQRTLHVKDDDSMKALLKKVTLFQETNQPNSPTYGSHGLATNESLFNHLHLQAKYHSIKSQYRTKRGPNILPSIPLVENLHPITQGINTAGHFISPTVPHTQAEPSSNDLRFTQIHQGRRITVGNGEDSVNQRPLAKTITMNPGSTDKEGQSQDLCDRLDMFYGIMQDGKQKVLNIKIYTYVLDQVYQVVIFEDETLRGKVDFLTKLNKYYIQLFQGMLKKMRVPIAASLFRMKKAINAMKHVQNEELGGHIQSAIHHPQQQQQPFQLSNAMLSQITLDNNNNPTKNLNTQHITDTDTHVKPAMMQYASAGSLGSTSGYPRGSLAMPAMEDLLLTRTIGSKRDQFLYLVEDLQFCSYNILNNLFNFQDVFQLFQKGNLQVKPDHLSLERVIADLKAIFQPEFNSRALSIYFVNDLSEDESYINTDEKYFKQVLINLITNSLNVLSTSQQAKGNAVVQFKKNADNEEIIDVWIIDTGPGFKEDPRQSDKIILNNLNVIGLERNLTLKDLKVGFCVSEKIVGRLGPYDKINVNKNMVQFQIYKDYEGLVMHKQQEFSQQINSFQKDFRLRKSMFSINREHLSEGDIQSEYESDRHILEQMSPRKIETGMSSPLHARDPQYLLSP